jgi:hypothetical protein
MTKVPPHFDLVITDILQAIARTLDVAVSIAGFLPIVSAGIRLASLYDRHIKRATIMINFMNHTEIIPPRFLH